jgi:hypothetical protein
VIFPRPLSNVASLFFSVVLGLAPLSAAAASTEVSKFTVSKPTEIPGLTLQPGTYSIHVIDHLSERYIVRVDSPKQRVHSTFLALVDPAAPKPAVPGKELWQNPASGKEYMRGWSFAGEPVTLEFVYPKADAVAIAKTNNAKVPAIDPASEGKSPELKGLSRSDLELITLWLLSATQVGPGDNAAGIQAERYPGAAQAALHKPHIAKLPQTASFLPWVALIGALSFAMAFFLCFTRLFGSRTHAVARNYAYELPLCSNGKR